MPITFEILVFIILLIDSLAANAVVWLGGQKWYAHTFKTFSRWFPLAKGWTTWYLILVLWMGYMLWRSGQLVF